jgi:hypothetical protein
MKKNDLYTSFAEKISDEISVLKISQSKADFTISDRFKMDTLDTFRALLLEGIEESVILGFEDTQGFLSYIFESFQERYKDSSLEKNFSKIAKVLDKSERQEFLKETNKGIENALYTIRIRLLECIEECRPENKTQNTPVIH